MLMLITHRIHVWDLQSRLNPSLQVQLVELVLATLCVVSQLLSSGSGHPKHFPFPAAFTRCSHHQVTRQSKEGGGSRALKLQEEIEQEDLCRLTCFTLVTSKWARNTNGAASPGSSVARAKATARDTGQKCLRHTAQSVQMNHNAHNGQNTTSIH